MTPTISCERLLLRPLEVSDIRTLNRAMRSPPSLEGFPEGPCTDADVAEWMSEARARGVKVWAIVAGHELIGLMTMHVEHEAIAQIGFYVVEALQGRGFTTEAVEGLVRWIFTATPVHRIALRVTTSNVNMWRVAQRIGFVLEGVSRSNVRWAGAWHDARNYALLRGDWQANQMRQQRSSGQRAFVPTSLRSA